MKILEFHCGMPIYVEDEEDVIKSKETFSSGSYALDVKPLKTSDDVKKFSKEINRKCLKHTLNA